MKEISIYTSSTCPICHEAKAFFNENNLAFTEYNISQDSEKKKELIKKGYRSVPVIVIDGEEILGFDKDELLPLLK